MVDQIIQGMFEAAGAKLLGKINRQKSWTGVDVLVARGHSLQKGSPHPSTLIFELVHGTMLK